MFSVPTAESVSKHSPPHRFQHSSVTANSPLGSLQDRIERTSVRKLSNKEHVYCEGDPRTHVFQIETGVVMIYGMLPDGRRQVIDFAYPGDFVGLGTSATHAFCAETTGIAKVRCIPAAALDTAARHDPELALALYKAVSQELSSARSLLVAIGQRSAIERIAAFLLTLCRRVTAVSSQQDGVIIELPMRRADIGDLLGLTIETVSRTITKLRSMRVIEVTNGTTLRIADLARLEELADAD